MSPEPVRPDSFLNQEGGPAMLSLRGSVRHLWGTACLYNWHSILICRNKINIADEILLCLFL